MKITLTFNDEQTDFIRKAQRRINANQPEGQKVTEIDVIRYIMANGHKPFDNYIKSLPIKTVKHLKLMK